MKTRWLVLVALIGCSGKDGDSEGEDWPHACDQSAVDGDCVLYTGADWEPEDMIANCSEESFRDECPEGSLVGRCTIDGGSAFETVTSFYVPYWTAPQAVQSCQGQGGSWEEI